MNNCRRRRKNSFAEDEFEIGADAILDKYGNGNRRVQVVCLSETHRLVEGVQLLGPKVRHMAPLNVSHDLFHEVAKKSKAEGFRKLALSFDLREGDLILVFSS